MGGSRGFWCYRMVLQKNIDGNQPLSKNAASGIQEAHKNQRIRNCFIIILEKRTCFINGYHPPRCTAKMGGNPPFSFFFFCIFLEHYTREPPITQEGGMVLCWSVQTTAALEVHRSVEATRPAGTPVGLLLAMQQLFRVATS